MELVYLWIEDYKNIKKQGFNFSPRFKCEYNEESNELIIDEQKDYVSIFPKNINITAIVGENGSGKTSLITFLGSISKSISKKLFACVFRNGYLEIQNYNSFKNIRVINNTRYKYSHKKLVQDEDMNNPYTEFFNKKDFIYYSISHLDFNASFQLKKDFHYLGVLNKELIHDFYDYNNSLNENIIYLKKQQFHYIDKLLNKLGISLPQNILLIPQDMLSKRIDAPTFTGDFSDIGFKDVVLSVLGYRRESITGPQYIKDEFVNKIDIFIKLLRKIQLRNDHPINENYLYIQFFIKHVFNIYKSINKNFNLNDIEMLNLSDIKNDIRMVIEECTNIDDLLKLIINFYKDAKEQRYINELHNISKYENFQDPQKQYSMHIGKYSNFSINSLSIDLFNSLKNDNYLGIFRFSFFDKNKQQIEYSSGEMVILDLLSRLLKLKNKIKLKKDLIFLIDEIELFLHPKWQKKYFNNLINILNSLFATNDIKVFITTHSPFILSDLPKENVIFLKDGKQIDALEKKQTFGANIHTLLSDGFFMEGGLMGEFAKSKIDEVIDLLNSTGKLEDKELKLCKDVVSIIGEPILKKQLQRMLNNKLELSNKEEIEILKEEMDLLKHRMELLRKNK